MVRYFPSLSGTWIAYELEVVVKPVPTVIQPSAVLRWIFRGASCPHAEVPSVTTMAPETLSEPPSESEIVRRCFTVKSSALWIVPLGSVTEIFPVTLPLPTTAVI